jgi:hypothetical protein
MANAAQGTTPPDREGRAREWIRALAEIPVRFAGTAGERQAAEQVGAWMRELGLRDVSVVSVAGGPRAGFVLALHAGLAAIGCLGSGFIGALLGVVAAWSFHSQFRRGRPLLSKLFHPPDSVNVIGRVGAEAPARRIVLTAHIDTAQAGWIFSPRVADRFARANRNPWQPGGQPDGQPRSPFALPEGLIVAGSLLALGSWLGAHGFLFALTRTLVGLALVINCGLMLQWAFAPATPGANDNASAVAAMLLCAKQLMAALPGDVELWLAGTGAEEAGCRGMHAIVDGHRDWPPDSTYFVNFECLGGGALHFIRSEGMLSKIHYPPILLDLARRVAATAAFGALTPTDLLAGTDGHVPARQGYPSLSLISLEPNGVPRNYHRSDDTAEGIDTATVVRAADFGAAVVAAALRGDSGPLPPP